MEIIRGFATKKRLRHWSSICEEWLLVNERYSRLTESGDEAFTCKERANIGLLAGAAWRCGRVALEEFQSTKLKNGVVKNGRVDLWLCNDGGKEEFIEAKFKWLSLNSKDIIKVCAETLGNACDDAIATRCADENIVGVGVAFLAFYIKGTNEEVPIKEINKAIGVIKKSVSYDAIAWCFPEKAMQHCHDDKSKSLGILLLAQKVTKL